ncbi:MAG: thiamine phosphate synthase [Opitutales bacterium]
MAKNIQKLSNIDFYAILDTGYVARDMLYKKCKELIAGNVDIIQLRAKKQSPLEIAKIASEISPLFEEENAPIFIINDDLKLAKSIDFAGLHLGQDDIDCRIARQELGEDRVLGLSTHSLEQATKANELYDILDYFAVGPVYPTNTKLGRPAVGLELLRQVSSLELKLPFFAIGGINFETAKSALEYGAKRLVAVSAILEQENSAQAIAKMRDIIKDELSKI